MNKFSSFPVAPPDAIFHLSAKCKADPSPDKVDLGIGAYRNDEGRPFVLETVNKVEVAIANEKMDKEYLPIEGLAAFRKASVELAYGEDAKAIKEERIAAVQTLSGTGAVSLAAEFFAKQIPGGLSTPVYLSRPTWGNHKAMFIRTGFTDIREYTYFNSSTICFDFDAMMADLEKAPEGAIVLYQPCAHNPTGDDPTKDQWKSILELSNRKNFIVLMDCAYQGYASGDIAEDAYAIRLFESTGAEFALCQSYSKNFGMYNERLGCLSLVCGSKEAAEGAFSQLKVIIRSSYSNPPAHGARIVSRIWNDPALKAEWMAEMKGMSDRIQAMRAALVKELKDLSVPGDWSHITRQIGMFSFTGLTKDQVDKLVNEHHIYMLGNGRMSIAGLSSRSVPLVAKAMKEVVPAAGKL